MNIFKVCFRDARNTRTIWSQRDQFAEFFEGASVKAERPCRERELRQWLTDGKRESSPSAIRRAASGRLEAHARTDSTGPRHHPRVSFLNGTYRIGEFQAKSLKLFLLIFGDRILDSGVDRGMPSLAAAPEGPKIQRPALRSLPRQPQSSLFPGRRAFRGGPAGFSVRSQAVAE